MKHKKSKQSERKENKMSKSKQSVFNNPVKYAEFIEHIKNQNEREKIHTQQRNERSGDDNPILKILNIMI